MNRDTFIRQYFSEPILSQIEHYTDIVPSLVIDTIVSTTDEYDVIECRHRDLSTLYDTCSLEHETFRSFGAYVRINDISLYVNTVYLRMIDHSADQFQTMPYRVDTDGSLFAGDEGEQDLWLTKSEIYDWYDSSRLRHRRCGLKEYVGMIPDPELATMLMLRYGS